MTGASSLQNLFQVTESRQQPATPERDFYSPTEVTRNGTAKLYLGVKDSPRNSKKLLLSHNLSQSALDVRQGDEDSLSLTNSHSLGFPESTSLSRNSLSPSVKTSSLSLNVVSSRNSTLIDEDELADIEATQSENKFYSNLQNAQNQHKPVIKSKSKEVSGVSNSANLAHNAHLKSTFYNLPNKNKKPAPPPPARKKKGIKSGNLVRKTSQYTSDLRSNLYNSDLALAESCENTVNNPYFADLKSSFKPSADSGRIILETGSLFSKEETSKSWNDLQVDVEAHKVASSVPEYPSPDYSASESEAEEPVENCEGARDQQGLLQRRSAEYEMVKKAREKSLAELEPGIGDQTVVHEVIDSKEERREREAEIAVLQPDSQKYALLSSSLHAITTSAVQTPPQNSNAPRMNHETGACDTSLGSPESVLVTQPPPIVSSMTPKPSPGTFQSDLTAAINKRKSQIDLSSKMDGNVSVEQKVQKQSELKTMQYDPGLSRVSVKDEDAIRKEGNPELSSTLSTGKGSESGGSSLNTTAVDEEEQDVDAVISQFSGGGAT